MKEFFTKLYGNENTKSRIGAAITTGTLAHAFLICGPEGSGKKTLAAEIAAALNCTSQKDGAASLPCHNCNNCRRIEKGEFTDVKMLACGADKATIGVEETRDFREDMFLSATESDYKIYIIDQANKMTHNAQNALLKVLEEPPQNVIIILLAESSDGILTTIKSRTQYVAMQRFDEDELIRALKDIKSKGKISTLPTDERLRALLMNADGRLGKALLMIDEKAINDTEADRALTDRVVKAFRQNTPYSELYTAIGTLPTKRTELSEAIESIILALRDLILLKFDSNAPLSFYSSRDDARELAKTISLKRLLGIYDVMRDAMDDISRNASVFAVTASLGAKIKLI